MKLGDMPAFPRAGVIGPNGRVCDEPVPGMTLRQYYAGLALEGLLALQAHPGSNGPPNPEQTASRALSYADALLEELSK